MSVLIDPLLDESLEDDKVLSAWPDARSKSQAVEHVLRLARRWWLVFAAIAIIALVGCLARGRGYRVAALRLIGAASPASPLGHPTLSKSRPCQGAADVPPDTAIVLQLHLPNGLVDPATVSPAAVRLRRNSDGAAVSVSLAVGGDGKSLIARPDRLLVPATAYTFELTADVKDVRGIAMTPTSVSFRTGVPSDSLIRFERVALPNATGAGFTCVQAGPDGRIWAGSDEGRIFRFDINSDGTLAAPRVITSLQSSAGGRRLLTGFCFDPSSTAEQPVLWVSHGHYAFDNAPDLSGTISRLSGGSDLPLVDDVVVHLPRSVRDHLNNQPVFGPDGALYFGQGSNSAFGGADAAWGNRRQHLLNATILRLDPQLLLAGGASRLPLDVTAPDAGGSYDPSAMGAPLTIYASGVRQAWDLVWHTNGRLYAPVNGSSAGGNTPAGAGVPALVAISNDEHDWLLRVTPGRYYGHPNAVAGHFVLNGGNPTSAADRCEVPQYPVGTLPDPMWEPAVYDFGTHVSADGAIEYRNRKAFGGRLAGRLIVCRYNIGGDLLALSLANDGSVAAATVAIAGFENLQNPIDVTEDVRSGNLYVSEYGANRITMLRVRPDDK